MNYFGYMVFVQGFWLLFECIEGVCVVVFFLIGYKCSGICWDDVNFMLLVYEKWDVYGQLKMVNVFFVNELSCCLKLFGGFVFFVYFGGIFILLQWYFFVEEQVQFGWFNEDGMLLVFVQQGFKMFE